MKRGWRPVALAALIVLTVCTGMAFANAGPEVSEANPPPSPLTVAVDAALNYDISPHFTDPDGDDLTFELIEVARFPLNGKTCGTTDCFANLTLSSNGRLTGLSGDPTDVGDYSVLFNVIDKTGSNTALVHILPVYLDLAGQLTVSPSNYTFAGVDMGSSVSHTFTLANSASDGELALRELYLNNPVHFSIENNTCLNATLTPGETCTLDIRFTPQVVGTQVTSLIIRSSDPTEDGDYQYPVSLQGKGLGLIPNVETSQQSQDFGVVTVGEASASRIVTVSNTGNGPLTITGATLSGTGASNFRIDANACSAIAPSSICMIQVSFRPASAELKSAVLNIASDDPDTPNSMVSLSGTGEEIIVLEDPAILVSPGFKDFGTVVFGTAMTQEFGVANSGGQPLAISGVEITGADAAAFTIVANGVTGQSIEAAQSGSLNISFSPLRLGSHDAILRITSNAPLTPVKEIPLTGNGDPASQLYFPHVAAALPWHTEICVINTSTSQSVSGRFRAYGDDGALVTEIANVVLPPYGRLEMDVARDFSSAESIGHLILETTSGSLSGYTKFYIEERYRVAVPAMNAAATGDVYLSHIASTDEWWTGVSLVNTTDATKTLTLSFSNGEIRTVTIAAGGHKAFTIADLFGGTRQPDIRSAIIRNAAGVVGLELFGSHEGDGNSRLSGVLVKSELANTLYYPHVATSEQWWTGIVAYNAASETNALLFTSYDQSGTLLVSQPITLEPRQKYIGTVQDLDLPENTAWFQIAATYPLTGFELFGTNDGQELAGYTGMGINRANGVFAKIEPDGWTGIAFVNIASEEANVTLTARTNDGQSVATRMLTLAGHEKVVNVVEDLFPEGIGPATYVRYDANREVVGFQLNGSSDGTMLDGLPGM